MNNYITTFAKSKRPSEDVVVNMFLKIGYIFIHRICSYLAYWPKAKIVMLIL